MSPSKQDSLLQARVLYAQGVPIDEIAVTVGVSVRTVARWKAAEAKAGRDWDVLREEYVGQDPRAVLAILDDAIAAVAGQMRAALKAGKPIPPLADALQKIDNVRQRFADRFGNLPVVLGVFLDLTEWAGHAVPDEDLAALRRVMDGYLAEIKRRHT